MDMSKVNDDSIQKKKKKLDELIPSCHHLIQYRMGSDGKQHVVHPAIKWQEARVNYDPASVDCQLCQDSCVEPKSILTSKGKT